MTTRNLSQARPETTKTTTERQPQSSRTRKTMRLAVEELTLEEVLPDNVLAELERSCAERGQDPATFVASAVQSWLNAQGNQPQQKAIPSAGVSLFHEVFNDAKESLYDQAITTLEGLRALIDGNPHLREEMYAISLILEGDRLLNRCPSLEQYHRTFGLPPGHEQELPWQPTPPVNVARLTAMRNRTTIPAQKAVAA